MLTGCCLSLAYKIPELPLVSFVPLRNPELFLPCFVTLAWLQGGRLRLTRYQAEACWGPSTLQSAPGALNRIYCVSSAALPALVDVCAHVALLYHTPAELAAQGEEFISSTGSLFDFWYLTWGHRTDWTTWLEYLCCHRSVVELFIHAAVLQSPHLK